MVESLRHMVVGGAPIQSRAVRFHLAEGVVAKGLGELAARYPELSVGSYPFYRQGTFGVVVVLRGTDGAKLDQANEELNRLVRSRGGTPVQETAPSATGTPAARRRWRCRSATFGSPASRTSTGSNSPAITSSPTSPPKSSRSRPIGSCRAMST